MRKEDREITFGQARKLGDATVRASGFLGRCWRHSSEMKPDNLYESLGSIQEVFRGISRNVT